jgi:hypothetical protein
MILLLKSKLNLRPLALSLLAIAVSGSTVGCGANSPEPGASSGLNTSISSLEAQPLQSANEIEPDAERDFRTALTKSQESAAELGLTELWFDADGGMVQVAVQDPATKTYASYDVGTDSAFEMDEASMMPARTLSELDGLVAGGADQGSVISNAPGEFTITNTIDLSKYVTIYTLDAEGRIAKSVISSDEEPLGEITYTYSVTKEGKVALDSLSASS